MAGNPWKQIKEAKMFVPATEAQSDRKNVTLNYTSRLLSSFKAKCENLKNVQKLPTCTSQKLKYCALGTIAWLMPSSLELYIGLVFSSAARLARILDPKIASNREEDGLIMSPYFAPITVSQTRTTTQ